MCENNVDNMCIINVMKVVIMKWQKYNINILILMKTMSINNGNEIIINNIKIMIVMIILLVLLIILMA